VETKKFRYVAGKDKIKIYASSDDNDRVFCGTCGSNILLFMKSYPDYLYLSMGLVDGNPDLPKPSMRMSARRHRGMKLPTTQNSMKVPRPNDQLIIK